ncbi:hypothetical protein KQ246_00055 [Pseudoalteromonas shioyasakiensis]|nr:hypothetical protein KQ246_00055 [Pseudoalteromonas shioyasakiensis]
MFRLGLIRCKPCTRCGLEVNDREPECPHCKGFSDLQAVYLKQAYKDDLLQRNKSLAKLFCKLTAVASIITLVVFFV